VFNISGQTVLGVGGSMGRTPNDLHPAASPLHFFGAEVRRLRQEQGLSQAELGVRMLQSQDLVRKVESAARIPSREFVSRCDEVLNADGMLVRLWPMLEREGRLRSSQAAPAQAKGFHPEGTDRPVLDWLLASSRSPTSPERDDAFEADDRLAQMRELDHLHGAGGGYPEMTDFLKRRLRPLVERAPRVAIGLLELAGYEAVDLGADGVAQQRYLQGLAVATASGERLYGGYVVGVSLGHLALHCGFAAQAVRLATAALHGTQECASPAVRAALLAVLARAHARLGNQDGCLDALRGAERDLARSRLGEEPSWIAYFGEADLADEEAHCFFDLGQQALAQRKVTAALALMPTSRVRRLAIDTALYSSSLARDDEVDEACAVGRRAVDYAAMTRSFRSAHRIAMMMAELQPRATTQSVRDLTEYVRTWFPAVPTLSGVGH
jgi:transcriptional regulator with XRE-family HTH domain